MDTARTQISNLLKLERFHRDTAQWELCRAAYHPDANETYINVAWYEGNVEDFLIRSKSTHQGKINILHSSFDPINIKVNGDRAISDAFCLITSLLTIDGADYELASYVRLASRLEKLSTSQDWRILSLEAIYIRDRLVTAFPESTKSLSLALSEEHLAYPKSYRNLAFVMMQRGLKPRTNLPHEGNPDFARKVLENNEVWVLSN